MATRKAIRRKNNITPTTTFADLVKQKAKKYKKVKFLKTLCYST